jgi:hypothetical protein
MEDKKNLREETPPLTIRATWTPLPRRLPVLSEGERRRSSSQLLATHLPYKYQVILSTVKGAMLISGTVVSHLEIKEWCDWKGYHLFSLEKPRVYALPDERTQFNQGDQGDQVIG